MAPATLADRMEMSLRRQIAAFNEMFDELADIGPKLEEIEIEAFALQQVRQIKRTQELVREYGALLRESEGGARLSEADRTRLRMLAQEVDTLTQRLRARYEEAHLLVQEAMHQQQNLTAALRRGKDMLTKYRPQAEESSDYFDRSV